MKCSKCPQELNWAVTETGKRMPLNERPDPARGNVLVVNGVARVLGAKEAAEARDAGVALFLPHFATCPAAPAFRKGAKR